MKKFLLITLLALGASQAMAFEPGIYNSCPTGYVSKLILSNCVGTGKSKNCQVSHKCVANTVQLPHQNPFQQGPVIEPSWGL